MDTLSLNNKPSSKQPSSAALTVLILDADPSRAAILKKAVLDASFDVLSRIHSSDEIIEAVDNLQPQCLVVGIDLPDVTTLRHLSELSSTHPLPVVMFAEKDAPQIIQKVVNSGVSAFVVDDIQASRISSIISVAMARFHEKQSLIDELAQTKSKLEERKILDRAKGLLMNKKGYSEDEAYKSLRKMSMDKGKPIGAIAQSVIDVFALVD